MIKSIIYKLDIQMTDSVTSTLENENNLQNNFIKKTLLNNDVAYANTASIKNR